MLRKWLWDLRCRMRVRERATVNFQRYKSLLKRRASIKSYLDSSGLKKLQIGCGKNPLSGWLNTDLLASQQVVYMDATAKLPLPDSSMDYIYSEHIFEHISHRDGSKFLKEAYRVLKPGGRIRIATPNMAFLFQLYGQPEDECSKRYIKNSVDIYIKEQMPYARAVVINNFFYNWGHQFIYDFETLEHTLNLAGFQNTSQFQPQESNDPNLKNIEAHGRIIGEEFNRMETIVVEAQKV